MLQVPSFHSPDPLGRPNEATVQQEGATMNPTQRLATWLVVSLVLGTTPGICLARGGGGHGGGGHFGGGGGHFGGGGGHFGGGHIGGGHFGGGVPMGGRHFGGGGNFGGGRIGGFAPSQPFHQPGIQPRGFNVPQGQSIPQMRSNFSMPGGRFQTPNLSSSTLRQGPMGGQGMLHHGVRLQPGHHFQPGQGFQLPSGNGQRLTIQPNHALYGRAANLNHPGGIGLRMHNGLGSGTLTHSAGRPVLFGNSAGANRPVIGAGGGPSHHIGSAHRLASLPGGGNPLGGAGSHHGGQNLAQFHGRHGGFGNPGAWGIQGHRHGQVNGNNWRVAYRNTVINNNYYGWYNPWYGLWGFGWYYPYYRSAFYWGLGPYYSPWWGYGGYGLYGGYGGYFGYGGGYYGGWGYGPYYNPYCAYGSQIVYVSPLGPNYYAQPLTLPLTADASTSSDPKRDEAFRMVEEGRQLFLKGDYRGALAKYDAAIPNLKDDPVVHELRALALFALGDYHEAAATLNALLAVAPGMDWSSMRNQYPDVATYTKHLRALESYLRENPNDAAARFVLGYHYLVTNYPDAAAKQFQKVVELEPRDAVAKKLFDSLAKDKKPAVPEPPLPEGADANAPLQTDLVGRWFAKGADGSQFDLTLTPDGDFTWIVTPPKGNPVKQAGKFTATPDRLILDASGQQETLIARVESRGPNHFRFWIHNEASLAFRREGVNTPEPKVATKPSDGATLPEAPIPPRTSSPSVPPDAAEPLIELPSPSGDAPADAASPGNR